MTDTITQMTTRLSATARAWVPDLIEARAAATPAVALRTAEGAITYADLWQRSVETSNRLSALGVGAGDIVAIRLPSGPDAIVAMLATWLSGAAFLPMDEAVPDEYCSRVLRDSGATAVFTRRDGLQTLDAAGDGAALKCSATDDRPAYIIYTSGSTGAPKGVVVGHEALAGHAAAIVDLFALDRHDTVLQFASIGFDVAQEEIWPTLAVGGALAFRGATIDADGLAAYVRDFGVSILQLPTAYWRLICAELEGTADSSFAGVRTVIIGGESATANDARVHRNGPLGHCTLVNGYGPTETVITSTALVLRPSQPVPLSVGLPIGDPVGDRLLYVLDEEQRPAPRGVPGELWVGGRLLADGYLNDPARSADRFRPDPFVRDTGADTEDARMYRTGDLVLRHENGELEFLGRLDNQVKVRGHRIELDEVDRHLLDTPGITAAVTITLDDGTGGQVLGAAVSRIPGGPTAEEIRESARRRLPKHMVPGPIFIFDSLPVTTSGKIDRRAVASLAAAEYVIGTAAEAPATTPQNAHAPDGHSQTSAADLLVNLLRELLHAPELGLEDDFLAQGGNSLIAMRVCGIMKERGWRLRPSDLMVETTIRSGAEYAERIS